MDTWLERRKLMRQMYHEPGHAAETIVKCAACILILIMLAAVGA